MLFALTFLALCLPVHKINTWSIRYHLHMMSGRQWDPEIIRTLACISSLGPCMYTRSGVYLDPALKLLYTVLSGTKLR